jgi:uncharacterized protein YvpB
VPRASFKGRRALALPAIALAAAAVLGAAIAGGAMRSDRGSPASGSRAATGSAPVAVLDIGGRPFARLPLDDAMTSGRLDRAKLTRAVRRTLPRARTLRVGRARIAVRLDRSAVIRSILHAGPVDQRLAVPVRHVASTIAAPAVEQRLHNDCESTALQVMLATAGVRVDQLRLQAELPRSRPLDPQRRNGQMVWGDPELGFVGRPDGGGPAGGYGVYAGPIARLAQQHGVRLASPGRNAGAVYRAVLDGRPVMAWVGLSAGPYGVWRSPAGRLIRANFGEHSIVLVGVRQDGTLEVVNPLTGRRELWSRTQFESEWARLGRRALAPPA